MKLTKKLQAEITSLMNDYWDSYFRGDIMNWGKYLVDDYRNIGGTEEEIWNSKKEILDYTFRVIDQMVGKTDIRNKTTQIIPYDPYIMVHEFMDLFIKVDDEWTFYGKFRLSSLIQNTPSGWKVLHQHGSYPDSHTKEGEAFAFDKLKEENTQLREAVKRRTIELENKNRELEIEASLERVRTVAMGMKQSEDLLNICEVSFKEFRNLGFDNLRNSIIHLLNDEKGFFLDYDYSDYLGGRITNIKYNSHPVVEDYLRQIKRTDDAFAQVVIEGTELNSWKEFRRSGGQIDDPKLDETQTLYYYLFSIGIGDIGISTFSPIDDTQIIILKRFRNVFDLAYRRYNDIALAEAQAKESQIEAALERVRSRSMGMQKSEELRDVIQVVYAQLVQLNFNIGNAGFLMDYRESNDGNIWMTDAQTEIPTQQFIPYFDHPFNRDYLEQKENGPELFAKVYSFEEKNSWLENLYKYLPWITEELKESLLNSPALVISRILLKNIGIYLFNYNANPFTDEENAILMRFGKVFEQTYTRFLDLKKAEAQAKEAQVELGLERVRAQVMGMHVSDDLLLVTRVLREQMGILGEKKLESILIHLYNNKTDDFEAWYSFRNPDDPNGKIADGKVIVNWSNTARAKRDKEMYLSSETEYTIIAERTMLTEWYNYLEQIVPEVVERDQQGNMIVPDALYYNYSKFSGGALLLITNSEASESAKSLLRRSAKVFYMAYTRFIDLLNAEAQAREAIKQASLDRVRGEIASMRSTVDLERITPIIWHELTALGVPFTRCGVFIMNEQQQEMHTFLSTPDGKAIAAFHLPYNMQSTILQMHQHWRKNKMYKEHWDESAYVEWKKNLVAYGALNASEKYLKEKYPSSLYLHFFPFLQGMLYVGYSEALDFEETQKVQILADVFSTAYARYDDFKTLESAKKQIEKTLADLKQAQTQLVQSEKMASLGVLTAGIAHEIQNPLNFVNNFSEVNKELLIDMREEIDKGNFDEVKLIAKDIEDNQEKINHHGKRADAIVKGMLQHSRSNNGVKEPTNINALADEYLRLAYHGMRAKDKSFKVTLKTEYDETIGNINIIPQDIGRVILNLITNAFYVVDEKKNQNPNGFEPTVSISTKKINAPSDDPIGRDIIEIKVSDNGNGIPQKLLDKIFQPFFTTKPTGQGTGLGLSLSYDIVKAHGGELKVETREGKGSAFIISIPIN